jgi:hypothetical protein
MSTEAGNLISYFEKSNFFFLAQYFKNLEGFDQAENLNFLNYKFFNCFLVFLIFVQAQYFKNLEGVNGGQDFDQDFLTDIYNTVKEDEIKIHREHLALGLHERTWYHLYREANGYVGGGRREEGEGGRGRERKEGRGKGGRTEKREVERREGRWREKAEEGEVCRARAQTREGREKGGRRRRREKEGRREGEGRGGSLSLTPFSSTNQSKMHSMANSLQLYDPLVFNSLWRKLNATLKYCT